MVGNEEDGGGLGDYAGEVWWLGYGSGGEKEGVNGGERVMTRGE